MASATLESPLMGIFDYRRMEQLRKDAKLSQVQAAKSAGVAQGRWSEIERGEKPNLTLDTLSAIAKVLKCNPQDLLVAGRPRKAGGK